MDCSLGFIAIGHPETGNHGINCLAITVEELQLHRLHPATGLDRANSRMQAWTITDGNHINEAPVHKVFRLVIENSLTCTGDKLHVLTIRGKLNQKVRSCEGKCKEPVSIVSTVMIGHKSRAVSQ